MYAAWHSDIGGWLICGYNKMLGCYIGFLLTVDRPPLLSLSSLRRRFGSKWRLFRPARPPSETPRRFRTAKEISPRLEGYPSRHGSLFSLVAVRGGGGANESYSISGPNRRRRGGAVAPY